MVGYGCGRRGEGAIAATRDGQLVGYCFRGRGMSFCVCVALFAEPRSPKSADRSIAAIIPFGACCAVSRGRTRVR